ncbi:MAG: hypothetical protein MUD12_09145 [Spirochaetes bacterium]|jgi:hypothetical protein|nr:hypothetical protein [Spirochaetota bacterium]
MKKILIIAVATVFALVLTFIDMPTSVSSAPLCRGNTKKECLSKEKGCVWIKRHKNKRGVIVTGHCRAKAQKVADEAPEAVEEN